MSYETYQQQRQQIERDLAFYQGFLRPEDVGTEGYQATIAMVERAKNKRDALNMEYYGTAVLYS